MVGRPLVLSVDVVFLGLIGLLGLLLRSRNRVVKVFNQW